MVGMSVRVEHRIQAGDALADRLRVKVRRGIDEHNFVRVLDHHRGSSAAVARIAGGAYCAFATQPRHTHGRAAPQHPERSLHTLTFMFALLAKWSRVTSPRSTQNHPNRP